MEGAIIVGKGFAKKGKMILFNWLLIVCMVGGLLQPGIGLGGGTAAAAAIPSAPTDIKGHWAEKTMTEWVGKGLIEGFQDGSLRPDQVITRIEFVALVNRLFAFSEAADIGFKDVPVQAWFASQMSAAVKAGYINGLPDGTFQPNKSLSRVEAAVMLSKLVPVTIQEGHDALLSFKDQSSVPGYGRDALDGVLDSGYIQGYPDQTVRPSKPLTRAEAVVLLDRILKQSASNVGGGIVPAAKSLDAAGTYGPETGTFTVAGDLTVNAPGTTLRHLVVKGNLLIGKAVGEGEVFLDHVTVLGRTSIHGGGEHSIHIDDSQLGAVVIDKADGRIRIVVDGTTVIDQIDVQSNASIESNGTTAGGIKGLVISASGEVILSGHFSQIEVRSGVKLTVSTGTIDHLVVDESVKSSTITLEQGVQVTSMALHGTSSVKGAGEIVRALVDAPNVAFETQPGSVETTGRGSATSGSSGGASGGSGGSGPTGTPTPSSTPTPTPSSTASPTASPTATPTPTSSENPTVSVSVSASEPSVTGFRLRFSPAVPNLTASSIKLQSAAGAVVAIDSAVTLSDGGSYRIAAALTAGTTYKVTLSQSGYDFGTNVSFTVSLEPPVDVTVTKTVQNISADGLRVSLNTPVTGLSSSNFSLTRSGTGASVSIASAKPNGDGTAYDLSASLEEGATYALTIIMAGYSFGAAASVFVPVTDPGIVIVTAAAGEIGESGFSVSFSEAVAGLTTANFSLRDKDGAAVGIEEANTSDEGGSYVLSAALAKGKAYTLMIEKTGYSFGTAVEIIVPGVQNEVVTPSASNVKTYGFILSMDKPLPDLDALNFVLKNKAGQDVSIDMLSAESAGRQYEVWATLDKADTYSLSLNKTGYSFVAPVVLKVEAEKILSSVGWITHDGFQIVFQNSQSGLTSNDFTLQNASGSPVPVQGVQVNIDGKSAVVWANLSAGDAYRYRIDTIDGRLAEGTVNVPATIEVSKYTTFNGYAGDYQGLTVHFAIPVPGLTASAFELKDGSGHAIALDSLSTADNGNSYILATKQVNSGGPFVLGITAAGYSFGAPATLVNATLNLWNAGKQPTQFMAGLNPSVSNLTKDNFEAKDASGHEVAITNAVWDSGQRMYIVTFAGSGGQSYSVSAKADGYDFGAPKTIRIYDQSAIVDPSYTGFTLMLIPSVAINTEHGFKLTRSGGAPVAIQSVVTEDGGASYKIAAALTPDLYYLAVDAELDKNVFSFTVPVIATLSVDQVTNNGLSAKLNYAVDGLNANSFVLVNSDTGETMQILSVSTDDQGSTYRLQANLSGGSYNLKLNGHLPATGVSFLADDTKDAGATTITNVTNAGFDLVFEHPVAGISPSHIEIRDANHNTLSGLTLTTADNGATYHVRVALASNADYTITLQKDYVVFDSPISFHVKRLVTGSVADVTRDGHLTLKFTPAFPEIENYLGLSIIGADGSVYMPNGFESTDNGASYQLYLRDKLLPGSTYAIQLNHDDFGMSQVTFTLPPTLTVTEATASGLQVALDAPLPGLSQKHFVVKNASGETLALTSAVTDDAGAHYTLTGTLAAGQTYTVQYKPDVAYQVNEPVSFSVSKFVTAAISSITSTGFKLQFGTKVAGLTAQQIVLLDPSGVQVPSYQYTLKTTDQGLSYQVTLISVAPGKGFTLNLARDEFKLAAPVAFDIPANATVRLVGTVTNKIVVSVSLSATDMTTEHFTLYDNKGKKVAITVTYQGGNSGLYNIEGLFDPAVTYTLQTVYPGYTFGAPLTVGFKVIVSTFIFGSQSGFKMVLFPSVEGLTPSDITVTDNAGNTVAVQSLLTTDAGQTYIVKVPLSGGKTYKVTVVDKPPYVFSTTSADLISLNTATVTVDQLSLKGFSVNLSSPLSLGAANLSLDDDQGQAVPIESVVTWNGGYTYKIGANLGADVSYRLKLNMFGYDFGTDLPISVRGVTTKFDGMESGNNNAFTLRFDKAVPNMRASDFTIKRVGQYAPVPVTKVSTEDGGYTYKIESSFWGSEQVTVLPVKDGYDFGSAVIIDVPVIVSAAVLRTGASYVDIGLNLAVPGLKIGNLFLKDSEGQVLSPTSILTEDGGATYRITAPFVGGQTYTITPIQHGYDFGAALSADLPSVITSRIGTVSESGITVMLSPAVGGLKSSNFTLLDAGGHAVAIDAVNELSGGIGYTLSADLKAGTSYTVALAASGYAFGAALVATVPIPVRIAYADIGSEGLTVKLDTAVPGLVAGSFSLLDELGLPISVEAVSMKDGGKTYAVQAKLEIGRTYSLSLNKGGYDFGAALPFSVRMTVSKSIIAITKKGFSIHLETAVPELTTSNFALVDVTGKPASIVSLATPDGGRTYAAIADLTEGAVYKLSVTARKYDFGAPLELEVQPTVVLSVSNITSNGFILNLSKAIPNLSPSLVQFTSADGQVIPLDGGKFGAIGGSNTAYQVQVPITAGAVYTLSVLDPAHPAEGAIEVILPIVASGGVTGANSSGITLSLGQRQVDLQVADIVLLTEAGDPVKVTGIRSSDTPGTYTLQANLAEGSTYSLRLSKKGYDFGAVVLVYVAYQVTAKITQVNENGFTLSLSSPVPDLSLSLFKNGSAVTLEKMTTPDFGQTYLVAASLGYNADFMMKLSKSGYDLGPDLTVNNASTAPQLIAATSSESGTQVILTFDKPLSVVASSSSFSVKIDGQWQSTVSAALGTDTTQIILTWNSAGRVIGSASTVAVAYTGVNRVRAVNQMYLATFTEVPVTNVSTLLGFVSSYVYKNDAAYPAQVLHHQYGKTALEAAQLLRDGGFTSANLFKAILVEYAMDRAQMAPILYAMDADALTIYNAYNSIKTPYVSFNLQVIGELLSAGYSAGEIGPALRSFGFSSRDIVGYLKYNGVSAAETANLLRVTFSETSGSAALLLKYAGYDKQNMATAVQSVYGLTNAATVQALAEGQLSASDTAVLIKSRYDADAVTSAAWLSQAGYAASAVGAAIAQLYSFNNISEAVAAFLGAGLSVSNTYGMLRGGYSQSDVAVGLLNANISARSVAEAVQAAGDGAGVIIRAMLTNHYGTTDIAIIVNDLWVASGMALSDVLAEFASSGLSISAQASLVREGFGADIATATAAIYPRLTQAQRSNGMIKYLLEGGYDSAQLANYFMTQGTHRNEVFRQLKVAGVTTATALQVIHDQILQAGGIFKLMDAMNIFQSTWSYRYEASEAVAALQKAFAQDPNTMLDVNAVAAALNDSQLWDKFTIAKALISQMGMTMQQWVELERTSALARFGCPCSVSTTVNDTQYLFAGATLQDITVSMSLSNGYTLHLIVEGTINKYPVTSREKALPYLTSSLKNAGYSFEEVAAEFDSQGWTEWITAFSHYGIAASDVAAYLKSKSISMEQVIEALAPYPLKDRALVLREAYTLNTSDAMDVLLHHSAEDAEDIGRALAWAYGSDPIALWIQTLRSQGATASSVINTLAARYPSYWNSDKVGPALVQGGFSQDEVMRGLLIHSSTRNNLQATIGLLQQLYGQQQVTIAQLLTASAIDSPASGIEFLKKGGYKLPDIARSLKDYYGIPAGEAATLLTAAYPYNQDVILMGLASVYGQTLDATIAETLASQGINNVDAAIEYLRYAGISIKDMAGVAKERFNQSVGQTALLFSQKHLADNNVLITTIAAAYNQSVSSTLYAMLTAQGTPAFPQAIVYVYQAHFSLATSIMLGKEGFGLSAGEALQAHLSSGLYRQSDVVAGVSNIYGTAQRASIVDSLTASQLNKLNDAVQFLMKMGFGLEGIVRVGKEHYGLTSVDTIAELRAEGTFSQSDIAAMVSYVYGQTLTQSTLDTLTAIGLDFSAAIPALKMQEFTLSDIVLAAKTYYLKTAAETTYALMESHAYATADILAAVAQYYGKPINQTIDELLKESGIAKINDAAPYLRSMGYSLQEIVGVSRDYYGNSSKLTIEALEALNFEDGSVIEATVLNVYGENHSDNEAGKQTPQEWLQKAGITGAGPAVAYLWEAGYSLYEIASLLKTYYGQSAGGTAELLIADGSFDTATILNSLNTVYGSSFDAGMIDVLKTAGIFTTADGAALLLSKGGYSMAYIAELLKKSFAKSGLETKAILTALNIYTGAAIQSTVERVYDAVNTSSGTMQEVLTLYGITTAEGAVAFLNKQNAPIQDILQYLKDAYTMGADQATTLLAPFYKGSELGLAVTTVYYKDTNAGYLAKTIPAVYAASPGTVANYMKGKFKDSDIVLSLKVIFNLDALEVLDAISSAVMTPERARAAVTEVFGGDPLFAYLKRMKEQGANANDIAAELDVRGVLETAPSSYLVNTLSKLGYDNASILKMRYNYYNPSRKNEGTEEEQGLQLVQLGVNTPAAIVQYLRIWNLLPYKVIAIVRAGLPSAPMADIALAMREQGYGGAAIMGGLSVAGEHGDDIASILRKLGLSVQEALSFLRDRSSDDQLHWLIRNGYTPVEYIRYRNVLGEGDHTIQILKATGMSADDLAKLLVRNLNMGFYSVAKALYDGGFTTIKEVASALLAAGSHAAMVPYYLQEIGGWTLTQIAQGMLDSGLISLADLVIALQIADGKNLKMTYQIIKAVSKKEQQNFYDDLNSTERKLLNNNEIAMIITVSALRNANISIVDAANQLQRTEGVHYEEAIKIMILSGFNVTDILGTVWDVYRDEIGIMIIFAMLKKAAGDYISDFARYYKLVMIVSKIVYKLSD